jgi:phenylacetate-CoA ligase
MRETIGRVFRAPIFDRYGTREAGLIATECDRHQGLHLMGETTVLEILDRNGREVGVGEPGETVSTNLWNYTMPLIRYRVQDQVVRGPDLCECGRAYPMVERVVGRAASCFPRPDGGLVLSDFWIRMFGVDFNTSDIYKYQFVQEAIDRVTLRLVLRPGCDGLDEKMREAIVARICDAMGAPCHVGFSIEDDIPPTESGKHLYSVSKVESN